MSSTCGWCRTVPYIDGFGNALRLDTLIVGRRGTPARLGYVRGSVQGPALVRWLAARIERRALTVGWQDVTSVDADVHIGRARSDLVRLGDAVATW